MNHFRFERDDSYGDIAIQSKNADRDRRMACAECNMFEWVDKMPEDEKTGKRYHSDCLTRARAKLEEKKAPVVHLVPREEVSSVSSEEQERQAA